MQFIKRWIYWHNFELGFIVNIDLWIVFCDKFWSADLMAHTPTHEWQVSLQSTYTWISYTLWTLLSYVKINIEHPVNPSCFQVLPPSLYTKLSTSSRRTLVVTTARIWPHFCVIHTNIISLHKLTHCVRDKMATRMGWISLLSWNRQQLNTRVSLHKFILKRTQCVWQLIVYIVLPRRPVKWQATTAPPSKQSCGAKHIFKLNCDIWRCNNDWGTRLRRFRHWLFDGISWRNELLVMFYGVSLVFCYYSWRIYPTQLSRIWH